MSAFSNLSIQSTFTALNGNSFGGLIGFGMYSSSGTVYYYVMHPSRTGIIILNDQWSFISFKVFSFPTYMINIGVEASKSVTINFSVFNLSFI